MKPLLPTLKEKKRYLGFDVISDEKLTPNIIKESILSGCKDYLGELGMAEAGIQIIKVNGKSGIIRVGHKYVNHLKSSLLFIEKINKHNVVFKSTIVSGTLKKVRGEAS